jgi:hypothetical protein
MGLEQMNETETAQMAAFPGGKKMNSKIFLSVMIVMLSVSAHAIGGGGKDIDKTDDGRDRESVVERQGTTATASGNRDLRIQSIASKVSQVAHDSDASKCDDVCQLRAQILEGAERNPTQALSPTTKAHVDALVLQTATGLKGKMTANDAFEQALTSNELSDTEKDEICGH